MIVIYEISDPITNEPKYIGQTNCFRLRKNGHLCAARKSINKGNWKLYSFIKHWLNKEIEPIFTIIDEIEEKFADQTELYWISQYRNWGFKLFNIAEGGKRPTNRVAWNKGLNLSKAHKDSLSKSHIGLVQSKEHIENRFRNRKSTKGTFLSLQHIDKIIKSRKTKKVEQLSLDGELIETHLSISSIKEKLKIGTIRGIVDCCKNKPRYNTAYGYKWRYVA